jgi:CTP synthase (UTP-ammonia lyase)
MFWTSEKLITEKRPRRGLPYSSVALSVSLLVKVKLIPGTNSAKAYGKGEVTEQFRCNFSLNPDFRDAMNMEPLQIAGVDENEEVRIVEIADHPFFIATLFLPQLL